MPPLWLIRTAVALVWLYEGLWCKLLRNEPRQLEIVQMVSLFGARLGSVFLTFLGVIEISLAIWVMSGIASAGAAVVQTVLLIGLNASGIFWARRMIHDPWGMVIKNFAFLLLAWVAAGWR